MSEKSKYVVGIAVHSYGHIPPAIYANHVGVFAAWAKMCSVKFLHVDGMKVAGARNSLVKKAIEEGCTHILFLDADHIVTANMLPCLLGNMEVADVVSGLVAKKDGKGEQVGFLERDDGKFLQIAFPCDGLSYNVDRCAFGCTLINLDVFKEIEEPYFKDTVRRNSEGKLEQHRSDMGFCGDVKALGKNIRIDTRVEVGHLAESKIHYPKDTQYQLATYNKATELAGLFALKINNLSCIDFGCGSGRKLVDIVEPMCHRIVGVDKESRIGTCKRRYYDSKVEWIVANLENNFKTSETFDLVICADVLEHLIHPEILVHTIVKHLKPSGRAVISTPDVDTVMEHNKQELQKQIMQHPDHKQFWNAERFITFLEANGLQVVEVKREVEITDYISMVAVCRRAGNDDGSSS